MDFITDWEEVDTAFAEMFSDLQIDGKTVPISYYSPDLDLETLALPSLVFYRTDPYLDENRWVTDDIRDNEQYDVNGKLVSVDVRKAPEPWSVMYSLRAYYEFTQDGNAIFRYMAKKLPKGAYITIKNIGYDVILMHGGMFGSGYKNFGQMSEGKRMQIGDYTIKIQVYLDIYDRETIHVSQTPLSVDLKQS
jgi:hypothetical protein